MDWSYLSGASFADVSQISVLDLPFSPLELWNDHSYSSPTPDVKSQESVEPRQQMRIESSAQSIIERKVQGVVWPIKDAEVRAMEDQLSPSLRCFDLGALQQEFESSERCKSVLILGEMFLKPNQKLPLDY